MPLLTAEEFDEENTKRVISDSRLAAYVGTTLTSNVVDAGMPQYASGIDLSDGISLRAAAAALDTAKQSVILWYNRVGGLIVQNAREVAISGLDMSITGSKLWLIVNCPVEWDGNQQQVTGQLTDGSSSSQVHLPPNFFMTGMYLRTAITTISNPHRSVTGWGIYGRRARARGEAFPP